MIEMYWWSLPLFILAAYCVGVIFGAAMFAGPK